jgi:hypothetical protein
MSIDDLESRNLIVFRCGGFAVDPGVVRHDGFLSGQHRLNAIETDVSLRRPGAGGCLVLEKNRQDFYRFERYIGGIHQFQQSLRFSINEAKAEWFLCLIQTTPPQTTLPKSPAEQTIPQVRLAKKDSRHNDGNT